ncbi:large ribosomal subunit protein mL48 [Halyomorpha halys]|uniref:large ribosomal subunit protein mL48 n=1 Tax=Halyomorpha halys TaxID=286706 RepID=UPI0006D4E423|nr:probable 28S ribosomal protein S10, mitochondrial [Halyomorpha halys]
MMRAVLKRTQDIIFSAVKAQQRLASTSFYDPPYLDSLKPKIPLYEPLNIQIKGYDFAVLESYQKEINRIAKVMDIEISDGWAIPGVKHKIQRFKPNSSIVQNEYELVTYERNLQVVDLPSTVAPIFFQLIQAAQPQGTIIEVHEHLNEHEIIRYIPVHELIQLKTQLTELGGPVTKKK